MGSAAVAKDAGVPVERVGDITSSEGELIKDDYEVSELDHADCLSVDILSRRGQNHKRARNDEEEEEDQEQCEDNEEEEAEQAEEQDEQQEEEEEEQEEEKEEQEEEEEENADDDNGDVKTRHNSETQLTAAPSV